MLSNLKPIYWHRQDYNRTLLAVRWLLTLQPATVQELRGRGLMYAQESIHALTLNDLTCYLLSNPFVHEATQVHGIIGQLRRSAAN